MYMWIGCKCFLHSEHLENECFVWYVDNSLPRGVSRTSTSYDMLRIPYRVVSRERVLRMICWEVLTSWCLENEYFVWYVEKSLPRGVSRTGTSVPVINYWLCLQPWLELRCSIPSFHQLKYQMLPTTKINSHIYFSFTISIWHYKSVRPQALNS